MLLLEGEAPAAGVSSSDDPRQRAHRLTSDYFATAELAPRNDERLNESRADWVTRSSTDSSQVEARFAFQGASSAAAFSVRSETHARSSFIVPSSRPRSGASPSRAPLGGDSVFAVLWIRYIPTVLYPPST